MKKELSLSGPTALFILCGLLSLHMLPGFGHSYYRYITDAGIAILLLAFGEQMLLMGLLFWVQVTRQIYLFWERLASAYAQVVTHPAKKAGSGRDLSSLLVVVLLLVAGTLSPSDGVDSGRYLPAVDLLTRALLILATGVGCFFLYLLWTRTNNLRPPVPKPRALVETVDDNSSVFDAVA